MAENFEQLDVFKKAYKLSLGIHTETLKFPKTEQFGGVADQIRRASKSICANLAEGHAKKHFQAEWRRFVLISLGSSEEVRVWCRYCKDLGYIDEQTWKKWRDEAHEITKMLTGLARTINK